MEKLVFYFLLLLSSFRYTAVSGATKPITAIDFITAACRTTLYPALCVRSLSSSAASVQNSDHQLAKAALSVSLNNAKSAAAFVSNLQAGALRTKPRAYQALKDCVNSMSSCMASLTQSVQELRQVSQFRGQNFEWHMNNVETWVSSALTNANTCAAGLSDQTSMDSHVKDAINRRMIYVAQITSNALALVNRFAVRHRDGIHMP